MGEKKEIRISVKDKIACLVDEEQFLVCGNNDYEVVFDFDSDWEGINTKTAVFVYGKNPVHQPFVGNVCQGVAVENATLCAIGVFAGNIKTTTGATIECKPSIRDLGGVPKPPSKEVYDEIMALLDKAIEAHTELPTGGKKGQVLKKVSDKDYDTEWANDEQRDLTEIEESLANKLDKTTEANKIYGTDSEGNQIEYALAVDRWASGIAQRSGGGYVSVPDPTQPFHAVPKSYADTKVAQTTTPSRLYGTNANGAQTLHQFSQSVIPWFIATRSERGELFVPYTPYADSEATSKKYVDGLVNPISEKQIAIEERVSDLESLTLTYTEDKAVAYKKAVPANVGKYALIKSIGGATKKVVLSKNILNPRDIDIQGGAENIVYNDDGSITLTIPYNSIIVAVLPQLPTKTYGMYWDNNHFDSIIRLPIEDSYDYGVKGWNTFNATYGRVELEFGNMDWNGEGEEVFPPVRVTFKVAIFEDTTEQPYEPFKQGFINAEVSEIKSRGANKFNQTLLNEYSDYFSVDEIGVTLKKSDGRDWANIPISYTLEAGDYTIHAEKSDTCRIQVYSVKAENVIKETSKGIATFTLSEKTSVKIKILAVSGTSYPAFIGNVMFSNGTTAIPYKPYKAEPIGTFTIPVEAINARVGGYGLGFIGQWDRQFYNRVFFENDEAFFENPCVKEVYNGADSEGWKARTEKCSYHCPLSTTAVDGVSVEYENITSIGSTTGVYLNSTAWLIVTDLRFPTLDEFKAHLSKNPLTVLWAKKTYGVTKITDLFKEGNKIEVEQGGTLIPVNANEMPVPTIIAYVMRKG